MTEKEFLEKRIPIWLEGEDLHISTPSNMDKNDMHVFLSKKYGYNWLFAIRGYYMPGSHVMLYIGDYECPNCTTLVAPYLFSYFPDIKYVGFGCNKGKVGEIWEPKIIIVKDMSCINNDIFNKQTEKSI
jgi:hypothetical protein